MINEIIEEIKQKKKDIGYIIDDRLSNRIPFESYMLEYKKLERLQSVLEAESDGRCIIFPSDNELIKIIKSCYSIGNFKY